MSDLPENSTHELEGQHSPLAQSAHSGTAAPEPGTQPDTGLAEHGLRAGAGESELAASGTRTPSEATRTFDTAQGQLNYAELSEKLAAPLQRLDIGIRRGDYATRALDETLLLDIHSALSCALFPELAGRYRNEEVQVGEHEPPHPVLVPQRMRDYAGNLSARLQHLSGEPDELLLEFLAYAEGELLSIHPFPDLNGRISRLWLTEILHRLKLPPVDVVPADAKFRHRYLAALAAADHRNWKPLMALWKERLSQPASINEIPLPGCTPTPLASYLKALAVLRLIAEAPPEDGGDPEATGFWRNDVFVLRTRLTKEELRAFFLERYRPTPLVAPWNGGSGFYFQEGKFKEKDPATGKKLKTGVRDQPTEATRTVEAILRGDSERFASYRSAIVVAKQIIGDFALREAPENTPNQKRKDRFIQEFRNRVNESGQAAIDCVVLMTSDGADFPPLMGTGGNDGNLDFTNNFMQRLGELFDVASGIASENASANLDSSLAGTPATSLADSSVGQFFPGAAGGPNGTCGFESSAGINPWDFVLAIEGAILFAASIVRRLESSNASVLSAPFTVYERLGTSGAASAGDDTDSRREIWMPLWTHPFTIAELGVLLAEGRAALNARNARDGLDFARAVSQLGVDRGISGFQRFGILKRQGKNHLVTPLNRIIVRRNPDASLINQLERRNWLASVQRYARDESAPNAFRSAARQLDTTLFALTQQTSRYTLQNLLRQLGRIEAALSNSPKSQEALGGVRAPMPRLLSEWAIKAGGEDFSDSAEFRIAAALGGLRVVNEKRQVVLQARRHLAKVSETRNDEGDRDWEPTSMLSSWGAGPLERNLAALLHRRRLEAAKLGAEGETLASSIGATCGDLATFLAGDTDDARIAELFAGLACVGLYDIKDPKGSREPMLPPAFALLKIFFTSEKLLHGLKLDWLPEDRKVRLPAEIPARLASGDVQKAIALAWSRLRTFGVKLPGRDPPRVVVRPQDGPRWLAALCIPLSFTETGRLIRSLDLEAKKPVADQAATEPLA